MKIVHEFVRLSTYYCLCLAVGQGQLLALVLAHLDDDENQCFPIT